MKFRRELFGYRTDEVRRWMKQVEGKLTDVTTQLNHSLGREEKLEAELERYKALVKDMRRQQSLLMNTFGQLKDFVMVVGRFQTMPGMVTFADDLESESHIVIRLRVFQEGFYRLEGLASDVPHMMELIRSRADVSAVSMKGDTIYVVPKEESA